MILVYYLTHSAIDEIVILHIMNWNEIRLQMLRNAYFMSHALDVIDINCVVLHRAACAVDGRRVGAYAIGYHGNSWHSRCSKLMSLPRRPMDHYWVLFIALSCRSLLRHTLIHTVNWNHDSWIHCVVTIGAHLSRHHWEDR